MNTGQASGTIRRTLWRKPRLHRPACRRTGVRGDGVVLCRGHRERPGLQPGSRARMVATRGQAGALGIVNWRQAVPSRVMRRHLRASRPGSTPASVEPSSVRPATFTTGSPAWWRQIAMQGASGVWRYQAVPGVGGLGHRSLVGPRVAATPSTRTPPTSASTFVAGTQPVGRGLIARATS